MNGSQDKIKFQKGFDVRKEQYNQAKWSLVNSPEYARMNKEDRERELDNFFKSQTLPYLKYQGVEDPLKINEIRDKFMVENLGIYEPKKKEEETVFPDYQADEKVPIDIDDILPEISPKTFIAEADVLQPPITRMDVERMDEASKAQADEIQSKI